jgi:serine protease Do
MFGSEPGDIEVDVENQPEEIRRAMRANVRIEVTELNRAGHGSGVVIRNDNDTALILTNRHVVDSRFALLDLPTPIDKLPTPRVTYLTKESSLGTVVWVAPDEVDLAIVRTKSAAEIEAVNWLTSQKVVIGEQVFAIGNPGTMDWTLTRGTVSQLRNRQHGSRNVAIIQTDASISPGSSGGGLYNVAGELIGINNSIMNPHLATGIGFSIRVDILRDLKPDVLDPMSPVKAAEE